MRKRYNRRYRPKRRKTSLKASNAGPILAFTGTVVAVLGALALLVFVGIPWLLPLFGVNERMPWEPTPTPAPTVRPTPTPHPVSQVDPLELQKEIVLTGEHERYNWYAEPCSYGDTLVFAAGRTGDDGDVIMDALFELDMLTGTYEKLNLPLENHSYVYPVVNDKWLVYLDSKQDGGGLLRAMERETGETYVIKTVYAGQPKCSLDGDILVWMERTGSSMDKLFACDLSTMESVTVQMFSNSIYGMSRPSVSNGQIIYADEDPNQSQDTEQLSSIYSVSLDTGKSTVYAPKTFVHDPMTNGKQWVWRSGLHGMGDDLYLSRNGGPAKRIAEDIVEYGLSDTFVAYSRNEAIFVYFFDDGSTHQITPDTGELTQLVGVSDGTVIWMDVTKRQGRDIMKYAAVR